MLINVKMPAIVGILTFMSRINFVLSWVEHEKSFITSGPWHPFSIFSGQPLDSGGPKYRVYLQKTSKIYKNHPLLDTDSLQEVCILPMCNLSYIWVWALTSLNTVHISLMFLTPTKYWHVTNMFVSQLTVFVIFYLNWPSLVWHLVCLIMSAL